MKALARWHGDLKLPRFFFNPTIDFEWKGLDFPTLESLVCLFILSIGELQDFRPALWSLVLVLAAAQALARTDRMYLLFWGDSLVEDCCAAVITGLALGYTLTTEFLFASILFGFSFFKTVRLIISRIRHPERELPTLMPRRCRFTQVAIRWAGSVILVALWGLVVPCWGLVKYVCSECWGHHYVWPHLWVVLEFVLVSFFYLLLAASLCLGFLLLLTWLFLTLSTQVFSLRELAFISEPGCCPNVRSRLMVLMRRHGGVEELNRLFLDLVAVGQDPEVIGDVLEHGAQVDAEGSLALRMACDPDGWECSIHQESFFSSLPRPSVFWFGHHVTAPIVRCLLSHGAIPPAGCGVGSLSVGIVSCLAEFGYREALHHPRTFGNAVCSNETAMIEYLMWQGANVDAGLREACALRGAHGTVGDGLNTVLRIAQATPLTDDTIDIVCQGDPPAAGVLLLHGTATRIEGKARESIAHSCLRTGYRHLAVQMITQDMISVDSEAAEEVLVEAVHSVSSLLLARLASLRFPKRALDHALARALEDANVDRDSPHVPAWFEVAKNLLQLGASLPVGYEEETARSHNARRAQFVREAIEMDTAPLTKAAR